ncbi:hypothetical protein RBH26_07360 [Natronolimnohabitans sp. A-GB9]|uniref:hypothetical protein n=1 Tax=Natronolimnohabitans sp. A-GB9 TaxID=3069757 RepID=UPI0027AE8E4A|nr:hypothetical protein [Natronolimnohabitans sp. A-GB9]MDQ2050301.1 hypothetical protein [Natronolimnohabitans sp. A-GB9]
MLRTDGWPSVPAGLQAGSQSHQGGSQFDGPPTVPYGPLSVSSGTAVTRRVRRNIGEGPVSGGIGAAAAFPGGLLDPGVGRAADARPNNAVLVGEDAREALGDVRVAVVTGGHWMLVTPAEAGTSIYPANK